MTDERNYSLFGHNTFGIDATCERFVEFCTDEELRIALSSISADCRNRLLVLGGGSNLLLTQNYPGTVLHSAIKGREATRRGEDVLLRCGSGEVWDEIVCFCVQNGWHGAENLSLIPGEVGASAVQNIGAYGVEAKELIELVEAVEIETGQRHAFTNAECGYAYRQSRFKQEWKNRFVITHVTYRLSTDFRPHLDYGNIRAALAQKGIKQPTAQQLRQTIIDIRREKLPDPQIMGNAGSFFMNALVDRAQFEALQRRFPDIPHYDVNGERVKIPSAWMIEQCGWKGKWLGRAGVHSKQALVLVNRGGATGSEILNLCRAIQDDVKKKFDIEIKPEVNIL